MTQHDRNQSRGWQDIAAEASREKDPQKLLRLTKELERTLEERYHRAFDGPSLHLQPRNQSC